MLVEFEVGNFLSFKSPVRLSMVAANPIKEFLEDNTFQQGRYRLLRSAVIYGANASGKTNLVKAMSFMRWFVLNSSKETQVAEKIDVPLFKLDFATGSEPSHFEVCFLLGDLHYRYGFDVDEKAVRKEWLFCCEKEKERPLFLREDDSIEVLGDFSEGKGLEKNTRDNSLFLSLVAQLNGSTAGTILEWFGRFRSLYGLNDDQYEQYTMGQLHDESMGPLLVEMIRRADVGIESIDSTEASLDDDDLKVFAEKFQRKLKTQKLMRALTRHPKFRDGKQDGFVQFNFGTEESEGTKKFFRIAGPLLDSLQHGYVLVVDELDAKLHPFLTRAIVRLFNSAKSNPKNAQLIFATHDTNLLDRDALRRDQIWFVEKTQEAASDLYSLAEIKVRNDAAFEKNYLQGRYGAIPFLGNIEELLKEAHGGEANKVH